MIFYIKSFILVLLCKCYSFCNGYIQSETDLFTTGTPILVTKNQAYRVVAGDNLELPCEVHQLGPYVILWRRKNVVLTAHYLMVTRDQRFNLINGFNLQIINVTIKDAGEYVCQIADDKSQDIIHKVEVLDGKLSPDSLRPLQLVPPSVQITPISGQLTTRKGENITFQCKANGNPPPNIAWFRKNNDVSHNEPITEGTSITLRGVDHNHAGVYMCTANNGVGFPVSFDVQLDVLYSPEIEVNSPEYFNPYDCSVELTCRVHGNPTPNVVWYLDGVLLTSLKRYHMYSKGTLYSLKIENLQASDFGNFSCESENSLGKTVKYILLSGYPTRAKFLSSPYSHTMDSYNLTWVVESFAPIDEVRLLFRKLLINESHQQLGSWQEILLKASGKEPFPQLMSYNIEELGMSSVFQALLQVRNRFGWSEESDLYQFYTRGPSEEIYELNFIDMELTFSTSSKRTQFGGLTWLICFLFFSIS